MLKDQSLGKKLGTIAFIIAELLIITFSLWIMIIGQHKYLSAIIGSQTGLLTVVWASKASANFAKGRKK